ELEIEEGEVVGDLVEGAVHAPGACRQDRVGEPGRVSRPGVRSVGGHHMDDTAGDLRAPAFDQVAVNAGCATTFVQLDFVRRARLKADGVQLQRAYGVAGCQGAAREDIGS